MTVWLPFLVNSKELRKGDLLVMPFDGGIREMCCTGFPPLTGERL